MIDGVECNSQVEQAQGRNKSQVRTLTPNLPLSLLKCELTATKIAEIGNFWYKFAKKGYTPLCDFTKLSARVESVPDPYLTPNFTVVTLKMWAYSPQNRQNWYFLGYKFAKKGYTPLKRFLQN